MKYACQYAIVRFLPYAETGEFANVGIVLACPKTGYFDFKLITRVRRISAFFEELDTNIFKNVRQSFAVELTRLRSVLTVASTDEAAQQQAMANHLFAELVRPREAMIRFDEARVVLTDDPGEKLIELFDHYVERNFATKQYQEKLVEREVQRVLRHADLTKIYSAQVLSNSAYHVRFPFVKMAGDKATRIIKPLHLAHDDATQLFDHGWEWVGKIRKLKKENLLPHAVLFAVSPPDVHNKERFDAFNEVMDDLKKEEVSVISYKDTKDLLEFAAEK